METRLAYFSDLHLESSSLDLNVGASDVVIAAGDIFAPADALRGPDDLHPGVLWLADRVRDRPVFFVPGNHDYERTRVEDAVAAMRRTAEGTPIQVLWNERVDFQGVRYLGTPLWSDPRKPGVPEKEIFDTLNLLSDLPRARDSHGKRLTVEWLIEQHYQAREFLAKELAQDPDVPKVVITHWAPSTRSQRPEFRAKPISGYWAGDSEDLVKQAVLWLHGHVHETVDYRVGDDPGRGRVLSNPRGVSEVFGLASNQRFYQPALVTIDSHGSVALVT